jgi:hypothetical protein
MARQRSNSSKAPGTQPEFNPTLQQVPLTLQPFFKEQIDLNAELVKRFPSMPLMSVIRFRDLYRNGEHGVATLATQDGSNSLIVDVSTVTHEMQFSFTYGSMLSLRFHLNELSDLDRRAWLENIETRVENIVFLWGQSRWAKDYVICVPHRYYISLLAFSPNNFEAAVRMTPEASKKLFDWLNAFWYPTATDESSDSSGSILSGW